MTHSQIDGRRLSLLGVALLVVSVLVLAGVAALFLENRDDDVVVRRTQGISECGVTILLIPPDRRSPLLRLDTVSQVCDSATRIRGRLAAATPRSEGPGGG